MSGKKQLDVPSPQPSPSGSDDAVKIDDSVRSGSKNSMGSQGKVSRQISRRATVTWNRNEGCFAWLESQWWFQNTTLVIIVINALWIAVDVEWNHSRLRGTDGRTPLQPASDVVEFAFCTYFFSEVVVRFFAFESKLYCWMDSWFAFDSVLVAFMVTEVWLLPLIDMFAGGGGGGGVLSNFSSFRLLRLLRLTRMARIMRFFPELMTLVKGMIRAMKAVSFILLFLVMTMYVFAIVFTSQLGFPGAREPREGMEEEDPTGVMMFASMFDSMMTLFTNGVLGDNLAQTLMAIKAPMGPPPEGSDGGGVGMMWLFIIFMLIAQFTLLNMLIGVLCQVIDDSAREEEETNKIVELRSCLEEAFHEIDTSNDGRICQEEWEKMKQNANVRASLAKLRVESNLDERLNQMQETLFGDADGQDRELGLTLETFMDRVVELRWDTPAGALDIEMLKSLVKADDKAMRKTLGNIEFCLEKIMAADSGLATPTPGHHSMSTAMYGGYGGAGKAVPYEESHLNSAYAYLRDVPTELLFHVLKTRSPADCLGA
eukprot:TRINITY_DN18104_c0_g1_i1.p1 TRINITY_DN18104_c0_g1~~TRINITY_DN18104_c0_g1_i1.p1  ORF type:complete len:542 (+),score=150.10 TRINITY_DN18104_c0_g1_i1:164-1789(+)